MKKIQMLSACMVVSASVIGSAAALINNLVTVSEAGQAPGITRDALSITNKTGDEIHYFYSNLENKGQTRWSQSWIDPLSSTWDWLWGWGVPSGHIEFLIPTGTSGKWAYVTIVYFYEVTKSATIMFHEGIYWTTSNDFDNNPSWKDPVWNYHVQNVGYWSSFNIHTSITFMSSSEGKLMVNWEGYIINF